MSSCTVWQHELLYIEVLYTVKHKIGVTSGGHSPYQQDLFQYAKEAFSISPEDHARLLAKATEEKVISVHGTLVNVDFRPPLLPSHLCQY